MGTLPLSTLIAIFCLPAALLTLIVPLDVFVISSAAFTTRTIPVFPLPPETLITPLFVTFPLYALIAELPLPLLLSSITAIPDDNESRICAVPFGRSLAPASPDIFRVPLLSIVLLSATRDDHFIP